MKALQFVQAVTAALGWGKPETLQGDLEEDAKNALDACNMTLQSVQADKLWPGLEQDGTLITQEDRAFTLDCTATRGSSTVVVALSDQDVVGCLMQISGYTTVYRVVAVTDTDITLDRMWVHDDVSGEQTLTFGRDRYEVPADYDRIKSPVFYNTTDGMREVAIVENEFLGPIGGATLAPGSPTKIYIGGESPQGREMIQLDTVPDEIEVFRYKYQRNHPELVHDEQAIKYPVRYHQSLVDLTVARLSRDYDNKAQAQAQAQEAMREKVHQHANQQTSESRFSLQPKVRRRRRRRY